MFFRNNFILKELFNASKRNQGDNQKDSPANIFNDALKFNEIAVVTEVCTAPVSGIGMKKRPVCGQDFV